MCSLVWVYAMSRDAERNNAAATHAGHRLLEQAIDAGIRRAQGGTTKPTLRRYTWSRLHTDLLDDNRWALVARRANAPLAMVEAIIIRLENHANRSRPRGFVGDFSADGMAARWNVEADVVGRIVAELEAGDIGWIDQDQIVTFWARNPDIVDETAAERQQRARDRQKCIRTLAGQLQLGLITDQQFVQRKLALKDSKEPKALMDAWTAAPSSPNPSRRDAVTITRDDRDVTTRADHIIKQEQPRKEESGSAKEEASSPVYSGEIVDERHAELWLVADGAQLAAERMKIAPELAVTTLRRWRRDIPAAVFVNFLRSAAATAPPDRPSNFHIMVTGQVERFIRERDEGARLPLPPVSVQGSRQR